MLGRSHTGRLVAMRTSRISPCSLTGMITTRTRDADTISRSAFSSSGSRPCPRRQRAPNTRPSLAAVLFRENCRNKVGDPASGNQEGRGRSRQRLERDAWQLASIVATSDDAIVSKTLDGTVISWNAAAERLFGYTAAEMIGTSIRRIVPPDLKAEEDRVLAAVARGGAIEHFETIRLRKDGAFVPISLTVSPIRDAGGVVIGASRSHATSPSA